jgi:hypothetical protein
MTTAISFETTRGAKVDLSIRTEIWSGRDDMAGKPIMVPDWSLDLRVNGKAVIGGGIDLVDHPEAGPALKPWAANMYIAVPAEHVEAVAALLATYRAEIDRRSAEDRAANRDTRSASERENDKIDAEDARLARRR